MSNDNYYWLFSASAQAISALFAFLLAGFALVQALMENAQQRDDTLFDLHERLKKEYYNRLILLSAVTGCAIILSLFIVLVNPIMTERDTFAVVFGIIYNIGAIVGAIWFVIWIINPDRYVVVARELLLEGKMEFGLTNTNQNAALFFIEFVQLERTIRDILKNKRLYEPSIGSPKMSYSFRKMIESLYQNKIISEYYYYELLNINKYRNIIFHGHETTVDESMLKKTASALIEAKNISKVKKVIPKKKKLQK
jgi:hypothetical protein